jgi:type VI protein secretion system component Hcp
MAVDMFIKIDSVDGETQDSKHKKEIDVLSWSWGMTNSGSAHVGGGAGAGKGMLLASTFPGCGFSGPKSWRKTGGIS